MNESVFKEGVVYSSIKLSANDIEALHEAKRILDAQIASPPTLAGLAKLVFLNEFKLKKGFKELFGLPVHAYVIDRRLELVRNLLENKKMKVTEAVQLAGYSDASHFAGKFRKKFGFNPSEYTKQPK